MYQLSATGNSVGGWLFKTVSQRVFLNKTAAEKYIPEFHEKCCDKNLFDAAVSKTLEIKTLELDLEWSLKLVLETRAWSELRSRIGFGGELGDKFGTELEI